MCCALFLTTHRVVVFCGFDAIAVGWFMYIARMALNARVADTFMNFEMICLTEEELCVLIATCIGDGW